MKSVLEQLKEDEGFRGGVYQCSEGKNTVGYGRNLDDNPLTKREALYLLNNDLDKISRQASKFPFYRYLTPNRRGVIIQMIFTMGESRFNGFRKMITALSRKQYGIAADEMLDSKWHRKLTELGSDRAYRLSETMRNDE